MSSIMLHALIQVVLLGSFKLNIFWVLDQCLSRWFAKRFLHPDVVAPYEYIFVWDEDLGVENFDPIEWVPPLHLSYAVSCI
jgi:hypothetical protein